MKKCSLAVFAALLLALSACTVREPVIAATTSPTVEVAVSTTPEPTLEPSPEPEAAPTIWGEQTLQTTFVDEKGGAYFDMAFSFPYAAAPGYEAVNDFFAELLGDYAEEARGYAADSKVFGYPYGADDQYLYANTRGIYRCDRFLTFDFSRNCWLGGPHPYYELFSVNFDLSTGRALTLPDLFTDWPTARARILVEIKAQIPEQFLAHLNGNPPSEDVDYKKMGEAVDFYLDDAPFTLRNEGVEFCFNKGRIASQADTPYYFTIPYEVLSDLWTLGEPPVFTTEAEFEEFIPELPDTPTIWGEQALRTDHYAEDGTWLYELDVSYPLAGGVGAGYDAINSYYAEQLQSTLTDPAFCPATAQEELEWYQEKYGEKSSPRLPFYLLTDHAVRYQSERLVSIELYSEGYSGGAHPFHQSSSDCFDLDTRKRLTLPDLFSDWPTARKHVLEEIQLQLKELVPEDSYDYAAQCTDSYLDDTPFFLTEDGLTIHYGEYAIGSYADGAFDFLIPNEILEDLWSKK